MDPTTVSLICQTAEKLGMASKEAFLWWLISQQLGNVLGFCGMMTFLFLAAHYARYALSFHILAQRITREHHINLNDWDRAKVHEQLLRYIAAGRRALEKE